MIYHLISLKRSTADAAQSFSIFAWSPERLSTINTSFLSKSLESWPASRVSGTKTKSLVLVFKAESVGFKPFRTTSSRNFLGKMAESTKAPFLIGMILTPFSNKSLA